MELYTGRRHSEHSGDGGDVNSGRQEWPVKCKQSSDHQSRVLSIDSVTEGALKRFIS